MTATSVRFVHVRVIILPGLPDQGCMLFIITWWSGLQLRELSLKVTANVDVSKSKKEVEVRKPSGQETLPMGPQA